MFDDDDPMLARVRGIAFALPGVAEKISHGRPVFFTKKLFVYYGGAVRLDGQWTQHEHALIVLVEPEDRLATLEDRRFFVPAYLGPSGWFGIDLSDETEWREIAELIEASYRLTAPTKLIAELDRS